MICKKHQLFVRIDKCPKCESERKVLEKEIFELDLEIIKLQQENMELRV